MIIKAFLPATGRTNTPAKNKAEHERKRAKAQAHPWAAFGKSRFGFRSGPGLGSSRARHFPKRNSKRFVPKMPRDRIHMYPEAKRLAVKTLKRPAAAPGPAA